MAGNVSKNQRSGVRQKPREKFCAEGHTLINVRVVTLRTNKMVLMCACDGYTPIDTSKPYKPFPVRMKPAGGKSRVWYEYPAAPVKGQA